MSNVAIHKALELSSETRTVVENEVGRPRQEDEEVTIMAVALHDAGSGENRQELARRLGEQDRRASA